MKREITVTEKVEIIKADTKEIIIECPIEPKFFKMNDDGKFFPSELNLFMIRPTNLKYAQENSESNFGLDLVWVKRNFQFGTDFLPQKDCRDSDWMTSNSRENKIRKIAIAIMKIENRTWSEDKWTEITFEEFFEQRDKLINKFAVDLAEDLEDAKN